MQDENTIQPDASSSADSSLPEPPLSLSTNPSDSQVSTDDSSAGTSTDVPAIEPQPAETTEDPAAAALEASAETTQDTPEITPEGTNPAPAAVSGDLESIKSSALQELAPLINELDQEPEERYRTLMMIIQSSDNQDLVKEAYDAAQKIEDKKAKAEALVSILNEINYFTGKGEKSDSAA